MAIIGDIIEKVVCILNFLLSEFWVKELLFEGELKENYKTEFAISKFVERYKESITTLNNSIVLSAAFAVLALYGYFGLPPQSSITIPFLGLSVSRQIWISFCPLISYGLQLYIFTSLIWFMLLRQGLRLLEKEVGAIQYFGDVSNFLLTGLIGIVWVLLKLNYSFATAWNYIWYIPAISLVAAILISPTALCAYFTFQLFSSGQILLAVLYSLLFIPSLGLSFLLLIVSLVLGLGEERSFGKRRKSKNRHSIH